MGNEQFAIRYAKETEICKTTLSEPAVIYAGDREKQTGKVWCDNKIEWSPQGTYLVTFHAQGVVLWGGEEWSKLLRFEHAGVTNILFSPKERFLITWNGKTGEEHMDAICICRPCAIIWRTRTSPSYGHRMIAGPLQDIARISTPSIVDDGKTDVMTVR